MKSARDVFCCCLALLWACGAPPPPSPAPPSPAPPAEAARAPSRPSFLQRKARPLACSPSPDARGEVTVGGRAVGLRVQGERPALALWPLGDGEVLAAPLGDAAQRGQLWRVPCAQGEAARFWSQEGADFDGAQLTRDGEALLYTGPEGVGALWLRDKRAEALTAPSPMPPRCQVEGEPPRVARDRVVALAREETRLVLQRGGPCGPAGDWVARELALLRPLDPARRHEHSPRPIADVAIDARGEQLWVADAGRCDEPGVIDAQTDGALWVSRDMGQSWQRRAVHDGRNPMHTAAAAVITDAQDPNRLLVYSARCARAGDLWGGTAFLSDDQGKTWRRLEMPPNRRSRPTGQRLFGVQAPDGDLNHLIIWTTQEGRHETRDAGKTWEKINDAPPPARALGFARAGDLLFRATPDGLQRKNTLTRTLETVSPPPP